MSPHQLTPLSQGSTTDFESDSDYLGTPVDPPSTRTPYVADNDAHADYPYYSPGGTLYDHRDYPHGHHGAHYGHSATEPPYVVGPMQNSLLLDAPYSALPGGCNQPLDGAITSGRWSANSQQVAGTGDVSSSSAFSSRSARPASSDVHISSLAQARRRGDAGLLQYSPPPLQRLEWEGEEADCGENSVYPSAYSNAEHRHPDLARSTAVSAPHSQSSYPALDLAGVTSPMSYSPPTWCEDGSPIDDHAYSDRFHEQGSAYDQQPAYGLYPSYPQSHPDAHFPSHSHYPYSYIDGSGHHSVYGAASGHFSHIHAPRPQQLHDLHGLHTTTCPSDEANMRHGSHHVLSIPSVPAPPPIPRPSSLIEDSPKKPLTLACYFCRKRKIACQSPPANSVDRTCNQCAKRKLKCVYPATSRRGIRPRMYDLTDESFRRPSDSLTL